MKPSQLTAAIFCLTLILIASGCTDQKEASIETASEQTTPITTQNTVTQSGQNLTVHFLDVDQGDSILLEIDGKSMLVDAGESDQGKVVTAYLQDQGISTLDYVVATHPHSDHIGGMNEVLNNFQVEHFVDSGYPHTSKTYENMLTTIDQKNIPFQVAQAGQKIDFDPAVDIEVLNPAKTYSEDLNENSVVLKVTYGTTSFLLMGDAGLETEERIMKAGYNVDADILKVGHHASRSGSGISFISAVSPEVSVIEVGAGNDYGHPHAEILERLQKASKVYRTDLDGAITVTTDGSTYTVTTEKTGTISSRNGAYTSSTDSTTEESETPGSAKSTVYVSDLNLQDEWVQISNTGSSPVSLNGWKIEDEGNKHTYTFQSYTLNAGTTVTVFTGKGTNSATKLYWQLDRPIWNNNGDTAYLYANSGKLISKLES
ncbi:MAG TPA: MBL fold metallo-hydrolase [Methanosarcina sp.]|jgi:beta-lactamase superfamily II metal-dependent hydrolase|nr:MBL fold metallo-hydrolase [Methanosarcina sp.]